MNPEIALLALNILKWLQTLLGAGQEVAPILAQANAMLDSMVADNRGPTTEEWVWLDGLRHSYEQAIHNAAASAP